MTTRTEVQDILAWWLTKVGAEGLTDGEGCGCSIAELAGHCPKGADPMGCHPATNDDVAARAEAADEARASGREVTPGFVPVPCDPRWMQRVLK